MREIKFRGYSVEELIGDTNWVYGFGVNDVDYVNGDIEWHLFTQNGTYQVEPKSVGQYAGLKDKNGNDIYEGDILTVWVDGYKQAGSYIVEDLRVLYSDVKHSDRYYRIGKMEIIGSVYENPELLEQSNES